ncbi:hypothetical protein [Streptomyces virginiae]|uniref:hypothetical protein n=1 Tax=Streptomyces virginiae TaxID=1961 RepID=UPI003630FEE1
MFDTPAPDVRDRMLAAHERAAHLYGLPAGSPRRVWGYGGRSLSSPAGDGWLRLVSVPAGDKGGTLWDGPRLAYETLPGAVPRPELLGLRDWQAGGHAYRAELYAYAAEPVVSPCPAISTDPGLPDVWWKETAAALDVLGDTPVPDGREAVREEYLRRVIPQFTGHRVDTITWSTAHGDLHWANITRGPLVLDWEGWGRAPYGFDAATLHVFSLLVPETADRVRVELAPILDRPEARTAVLTVCAQVLQAADRTDFYTALAGPVRRHLETLGAE